MKGIKMAKQIVETGSRQKKWTVTRNYFRRQDGTLLEIHIVCDDKGVQVCKDSTLRGAVLAALHIAKSQNDGPVEIVGVNVP